MVSAIWQIKGGRPYDFSCDLGVKSGDIPEEENSYPRQRIWGQESEAKRAAHSS
ncbi:MAG: hypothetical protein GY943_33945 [Chloroflexi bacterium]|nr:hypothetical protein [Chloroflexota bacterium]